LKQGEWLRFYAERFRTVEVNMTFYRLPKAELLSRWADMTPKGFRFAVKLWRLISHQKRLNDCDRELRDFLGVVAALGEKAGPLLIQLPPSQRCDLVLLNEFLFDMLDALGVRRWQVAVEFRNADWIRPEVNAVLDKHGAALCLADMSRCTTGEPNHAPFVYVRRHGPGERYRGCYTRAQLRVDADRFRSWMEAGRDVYVYFNNDIGGHAVANATDLRHMIERAPDR
jgi:uncharacterized protein YecE (DUF72 family)